MPYPILWERETILKTVADIKPRLASWDKDTHPSQVGLRVYRDALMAELLPLPPDDRPLFLHLDVDVEQPSHLLKHYDLENYLTPLFGGKGLDAARFFLVSARKYVGGGSRLLLGTARPAAGTLLTGWDGFTHTARGSTQTKQWKVSLRDALAGTNPRPLTAPAVEVQIAWTCSPGRNWTALWKPTGDCMGPVLGEENPLRPFSPNDDRIVALTFHRVLDEAPGYDVGIHMWWRPAEHGQGRALASSLEE